MRNQTALEDLGAKVSLLLEKFVRVKDENIMLSGELAEAKKQIEEQEKEILRLLENEELRDMELEDISQKIAKLLV